MVLTIVALSGCDESTPKNNEADVNSWSELKGNVIALNDEAAKYVESYESDSIITFTSATPENLIPSIGTVIYVPVSEKTPYGYLGKVSKIQRDGGYKVFTDPAPLDEVFGNLSVDGSIESIDAIEEVLDGDGNPIEYELVDSVFQEDATASTQSRTGDFYMKDKLIRFPFKIYKGKTQSQSIAITGTAYAGFKQFKLSLDINNNATSYVNLDVTPCVGLNANSKVRLAGGKIEEEIRIGQLRFRATIMTPAGIPIIIPITLYVYGTCGASGELTATLSFKPEYSTSWNVRYKNEQWTCDHKDASSKNPWIASEFEVKGEVFCGTKLGVLVGLYSATTGIGINIIPKYSLGCSASIKSENILNINPLVDQTLKISSEAYCVAKLFGKQLGKATFQFPDYILWNEKVYLLPQYSDFNAVGNGTHGEISYKIDQHYFLEFLGFKHGLTIFEDDKISEIETAYPSYSKIDQKGYSYYEFTTKDLAGGKTYFASPTIFGLNRKFHGEKHEFSTEATYNLGFRCSGREYDVISFSFSLNDITGNKLDYTTEGNDYDGGSAFRVHITGDYNATAHTLIGQFDFYFYNDPEQKRIDGFTVNLSNGDSGYVDCSKIVDNGGCYAAVRIYNAKSNSAKMKKYNKPLYEDDDCNVGLYNKYRR